MGGQICGGFYFWMEFNFARRILIFNYYVYLINKLKNKVEKIYIENFAGIKSMDFEFKSINILIGPQGSGKSITVKLLYFFKNFINEIVKNIENEESKRELDKKQKETFITFFPKESWSEDNFLIIYNNSNNNTSITLKKLNSKLVFEYSENLSKLLKKARKIYSSEKIKLLEQGKISSFRFKREISTKVTKCIQEELGLNSTYEQFFIPAGRSFFANVQNTIFSFLSENRSLDPFLVEFGSSYESLKRFYNNYISSESNDKEGKEFDILISQILNSKYVRDKEKDYLMHEDSRKVNLANASSGQQETLPLMIILKALNYINSSDSGFTLYIEEPEAHLFPTAQKKIVELLARTFNNQQKNFQIFITTHSPYILSSFNNLIYAGNLANHSKNFEGKVEKVVPRKEQLESLLFSVYSIKNNEKKYLIDEDSKLISSTILDFVSEEISMEFDKLLNIEF